MQTRFRYILLKAFWEGTVSRQDLMTRFEIATTQATKDFRAIKEAYPNAVHYDATLRRYIPSQGIHLYLDNTSFEAYQQLVMSQADLIHQVSSLYPKINAEHYRLIFGAIQQQTALKLNYFNQSNHPTDTLFFPHHLIQTPFSWLVRGWLSSHQSFQTLDLAHWISVEATTEVCSKEIDVQWEQIVDVLLIVNPQLNGNQKKVIERARGLEKGVLHLQTRAPLLSTLLQIQQVIDLTETACEQQALVLGNPKDLKPYLGLDPH